MTQGYLCLVFHGHLPYVRHPEHDYFLEENWFFEALTDTYLPLLGVWEGLVRDGIPFRLTVSLSPTLMSMMADSLLISRYQRHLDRLIELAEKELERNRHYSEFYQVAQMYCDRFGQIRERYRRYRGDLIGAFRRLEQQGVIELATSSATHGFLPLLSVQPTTVETQVRVGIETFKHFVGHPPKGFWLPECGYYIGVDEILRKTGLRYCFLESHGLLYAQPRPKYGVYAPIYTDCGLVAFGRDPESSKQVWSAEEGYPGDIDYREYYRDIGFDLDYNYVRPYIHPDGIRINTGIKYYRITGKTNHKEPYVRSWALAKSDQHAGNFLFNRQKQIEWLVPQMGRPPIVVAPYDLELFGHWWFEGPEWLDLLIRKLVCDQQSVKMVTPSEYLDCYPINQVTSPSASSWGYKGYNEVWLNGKNDWVWRHLHHAGQRMEQLVRDHPSAQGVKHRALNQTLKELLMAQSSDWPFMMKTGQQTEYAVKRIKDHLLNFLRLSDEISSGQIEEPWLKELEERDNLFPFLDYRSFHS